MTEKLLSTTKNIPNPAHIEDYIRSMGEQRDGLTTTTAGAVVPKEVINDVWDLKQSDYDLAKYVTVKQVGTPVGTYPIALTNNGVLATKAELAHIPEIDSNLFRGVDCKVATRAGKIYLSNELVEDSEVDIVAEVKNQLKKLVQNTDNSNIISVLTGKTGTNDNFKHITGTGLDDIKQTFNVELDPALSLSVIVNQDAFNYLGYPERQRRPLLVTTFNHCTIGQKATVWGTSDRGLLTRFCRLTRLAPIGSSSETFLSDFLSPEERSKHPVAALR